MLVNERRVIVDENDKPLGTLDKKTCRSLHRALLCPYKNAICDMPLDGEY